MSVEKSAQITWLGPRGLLEREWRITRTASALIFHVYFADKTRGNSAMEQEITAGCQAKLLMHHAPKLTKLSFWECTDGFEDHLRHCCEAIALNQGQVSGHLAEKVLKKHILECTFCGKKSRVERRDNTVVIGSSGEASGGSSGGNGAGVGRRSVRRANG